MPDVNVQIGTQGDVTGLKQIETGYQNLINKSKQAYRTFQERAPMQVAADRQLHERKMGDLERKATDLERKIMGTKLNILEPRVGPSDVFVDERGRTRDADTGQYVAGDGARGPGGPGGPGRGRSLGGPGRIGRFGMRKALKVGGAIAGIAGAYSLFSNIAGQMQTADEMNLAYAQALSATRGKQDLDYSVVKPFYDVQKVLEKMGQTAYMTSKEMVPLLDVAKELGDLAGGRTGTTGGRLINVANIGKSLGVETGVLAEIFTGGFRRGNFARGQQGQIEAGDMVKMMMLNQNMMHRATESLQSMQQVISGTTTGTRGLGAFGMFNLMDALNRSQSLAYRGTGGARAMMDINQAFRGGGNENLQYFQTLALNPAFQGRNRARVGAWEQTPETGANFGTGYYDQLIADIFKDLGAYATPQDVIQQLTDMGFGGAAGYVKGAYKDPGKMNIERVMEQYRATYGSKNEGRRLFMTAQLAKDLGVSFTDVGVLNEALKDKTFLARAKEGQLTNQEMTEAYGVYKKGGRQMPALETYMQARQEKEEVFIETARGLRDMVDNLLPELIQIMKPAAQAVADHLPGIGTGVGKIANFISKFMPDIEDPSLGEVPMGPVGPFGYMGPRKRGIGPKSQMEYQSFFSQFGIDASKGIVTGTFNMIKDALEKATENLGRVTLEGSPHGMGITEEIKKGFEGVRIANPNIGQVDLD